METIIPEIDEVVNFYSPELIEQVALEPELLDITGETLYQAEANTILFS